MAGTVLAVEMNQQMEQYAKQRTATIKSASSYKNNSASNEEENDESTVLNNKEYKSGSIAGYAHMLSGKKDKK